MESDFRGDDPDGSGPSPSPSEARAALSGLDVDGARLAHRVVTPWWYHLTLGIIVALFVASPGLPGLASPIVVALGIIALPLLMAAYSRRYGISISSPVGRRSRRLLFLTVGVLLLTMVAGLTIKVSGIAWWWGLVPAAAALGVTVVLGHRYDDVLRSELARNTDEDA